MIDESPGPAWIAGVVAVAAVIAASIWLGLGALAKPADFDDRVTVVESKVRDAERLAKTPGDPSTFAPGAVCAGLSAADLQRVRQGLESAAAEANVTLSNVSTLVSESAKAGAPITPINLRLEAQGRYDLVLTMVDRLAKSQPQVFVDTLDLSSEPNLAHLKLSGRVFCWTGV